MINELVSIGIITYNQEDLIGDCLQSCLNQTYDNFEVIVADDCSQDKTRDIIIQFVEKYPGRIRYIFNAVNLGITKNSNIVLRACKGTFVVLMGGDDELHSEKVSKQVDRLQENSNLAFCGHDVDVYSTLQSKSLGLYSQRQYPFEGSGCTKIIEYGQPYCAMSIMFRRSCIPEYGYDERLLVVSDWKLCIDALTNNDFSYGYIKEVLGIYKRHSNNITDTINNKRMVDCALTLDIVEFTHPKYKKFANNGRIRLYYFSGISYGLNKDILNASYYFFKVIFSFRFFNIYYLKSIYHLFNTCLRFLLKNRA